MKELKEKYDRLFKEVVGARKILDLDKDRKELKELEAISQVPTFWQDNSQAKDIMKKISQKEKHIETWDHMHDELKEALDLTKVTEEKEHEIVDELEKKLIALDTKYHELETQLFLGEEYDKNNAIVSIHSGAGGVDAQDWTEMLLRMYLRYAERNEFETKILNISSGDEAGIKNVTFEVYGQYSYGFLKNERGVHRLVRLSPFDSDHARHTSFALVDVFPELDEKTSSLDERDLKIETFRASGNGGQSVNTTDSAVRITHVPTNISVSCQNERSQLQNKKIAMRLLASKLKTLEDKKRMEEEKEIRGESISAEWGSQIRSYVIHPYNMVKDLRNGYETSNTAKVLDGDIGAFIDAQLKKARS